VGGALSEAEELDHEDAVVAASFALEEEGVEVGAESVLSLRYLISVQMFQSCKRIHDLRFGRSFVPRARIGYIGFRDVAEGE
jgi:hypothetical protein